MQLTTSSEPKSSRPTAKKQNKKTHSSQGFMTIWVHGYKYNWQGQPNNEVQCLQRDLVMPQQLSLQKINSYWVWQWIFSRKLASTNKTSIWSKKAVTTRMLYQQSSTKLMWRSLWRNLVEISQCNSTILPAWSGLCVYSAQSFQLQICALIHVHNLSNCKFVLSFMLKYSHKHGVP